MPELPATVIGQGCFDGMFFRCYSIAGSVVLPATLFTNSCYNSMLRQTAITDIKIEATGGLQGNSMLNMLYQCSALSKIEVNITSWGTVATATQDWVYGLAASGTFIKPTALPEEYGPSRIPEGWTVINK